MSKPLAYIRMRDLANDPAMPAALCVQLRGLSWEVQAYEKALFDIMAVFHGNPTRYMEAAKHASEIADKVLENLDMPAEGKSP